MTKRAATDVRPGSEKVSRRATSGQAREKPLEDEMGEFEDAWEDEIDEDDAAHSDGVCVV
jgi:ribosome assembly protein RRB1